MFSVLKTKKEKKKKKARCGNYFIPIRLNFDLPDVLCKH